MFFEGPGALPAAGMRDFTGRESLLAELELLLREPTTSCVIATGIGGIGKSTLAQQFVARHAFADFPDGALWLNGRDLIRDLARVSRRFGWSDEREPTPSEANALLKNAVRDLRLLVVVDDFDPNTARPTDVPIPGGACRTLVTSRVTTLVDDLSNATALALTPWSDFEALAYLRRRCTRLAPIADADLLGLIRFCGGLPLCVRLAASFLLRRPSLSPAEALKKLGTQPLGVLEFYRGDHPGLVATFQATWDALGPDTRRVLQAVSACARRTRTAVVEAIARVADTAATLDELAVQSLVELHGDATPWGSHEVVRMFTAVQEGQDELVTAHLAWVEAHLARYAHPTLHRELSAGVEEITHALLRLLDDGSLDRAMAIYHPLIAHLERVGRLADVVQLSQLVLQYCPLTSVAAAGCLIDLGQARRILGDLDGAVEAHLQALDIACDSDDRESEARAVSGLGICTRLRGDPDGAMQLHEHALSMFRESDELIGQSCELNNLALCHMTRGDVAPAIVLLEISLEIDEGLGRIEGQASTLGNLGICSQQLDQYTTAVEFYTRAMAVKDRLERPEAQASHLGNLGMALRMLGDVDRAIDCHQRALVIDRKLGRLEGESNHLGNLGVCHKLRGDPLEALAYHQCALAIEERLGRGIRQTHELGSLASCYQDLGDADRAILCHERAIAIEATLGRAAKQADRLRELGMCCGHLKRYSSAVSALERALDIDERLGRVEQQGISLALLRLAHEFCGDTPRAREYLDRLVALLKSTGLAEDGPELQMVRTNLAFT